MGDKVIVFQDTDKDWRWHRIARNRKILSCSGEGYANRKHAIKMAERCNTNCHIYQHDSVTGELVYHSQPMPF